MRLIILSATPKLAASTRYRIHQYIPYLEANGIECQFHSFVSEKTFLTLYKKDRKVTTIINLSKDLARSIKTFTNLYSSDIVWIEREAALFGPPILEWVAKKVFDRPIILDIDDAMYEKRDSPVYGWWINLIKFYGKTDLLINWAFHVVCGNYTVEEYVKSIDTSKQTSLVPTSIDTDLFTPRPRAKNSMLTLGWIGSHSTFKFIENLKPVLERLSQKHTFRLLIVGGGTDYPNIENVEIENRAWQLDREIGDFQDLDIGLYPLPDNPITKGKSGFKAIQYMAIGIPCVASPVGISRQIIEHEETGYLAQSDEEWYLYLEKLLLDGDLRKQMGIKSRQKAISQFDAKTWANHLAHVIKSHQRLNDV